VAGAAVTSSAALRHPVWICARLGVEFVHLLFCPLPCGGVGSSCYNGAVITYSRKQIEKELVSDQKLWRRVPAAATAILWSLEVVLLGWGTGWWLGLTTLLLFSAASVVVPPRLRISIYVVDMLDRVVRLPLDLCWLLLVWDLWMREPIFPLLNTPAVGAIGVTLGLFVITRLLSLLTRFATGRLFPQKLL